MKKTLTILILAAWFISGVASCSAPDAPDTDTTKKERNFSLLIYSPNVQDGTVECDSFKMTSRQEAVIWVDGSASTIKAEEIIPSHNNK